MKRVSGIAKVAWTVELPDDPKLQHYERTIATDIAIGVILEYTPQMGRVYAFDDDKDFANVYIELHEEDFEIEEDERDPK
jgi:hypothetical protein